MIRILILFRFLECLFGSGALAAFGQCRSPPGRNAACGVAAAYRFFKGGGGAFELAGARKTLAKKVLSLAALPAIETAGSLEVGNCPIGLVDHEIAGT